MSTMQSEVTLKYFAWVREMVGYGEEKVRLPPHVHTVADLLSWLKTRGPEFENAFSQPRKICAALDKNHVQLNAPVMGVQEIALFPPVTGG